MDNMVAGLGQLLSGYVQTLHYPDSNVSSRTCVRTILSGLPEVCGNIGWIPTATEGHRPCDMTLRSKRALHRQIAFRTQHSLQPQLPNQTTLHPIVREAVGATREGCCTCHRGRFCHL